MILSIVVGVIIWENVQDLRVHINQRLLHMNKNRTNALTKPSDLFFVCSPIKKTVEIWPWLFFGEFPCHLSAIRLSSVPYSPFPDAPASVGTSSIQAWQKWSINYYKQLKKLQALVWKKNQWHLKVNTWVRRSSSWSWSILSLSDDCKHKKQCSRLWPCYFFSGQLIIFLISPCKSHCTNNPHLMHSIPAGTPAEERQVNAKRRNYTSRFFKHLISHLFFTKITTQNKTIR